MFDNSFDPHTHIRAAAGADIFDKDFCIDNDAAASPIQTKRAEAGRDLRCC